MPIVLHQNQGINLHIGYTLLEIHSCMFPFMETSTGPGQFITAIAVCLKNHTHIYIACIYACGFIAILNEKCLVGH